MTQIPWCIWISVIISLVWIQWQRWGWWQPWGMLYIEQWETSGMCQRWKSDIQDAAVPKLIFRNINPCIVSQLLGSITTVDKLVRPWQELEKYRASRSQYDQWKKQMVKPMDKMKSGFVDYWPTTTEKQYPPVVYFWRCKGNHGPYSCWNFNQSRNSYPS